MEPKVTKDQYKQAYRELEMLVGHVGMDSKLVCLNEDLKKRVEALENLIFAYETAQLGAGKHESNPT